MEASEDYTTLFDQYLRGELDKAKVIEFENRLETDEHFLQQFNLHKETLEGIDQHFDEMLKSKLKVIEQEISHPTATSRPWVWWAIAAAVTLLLVSTFLLYAPRESIDDTFQAFYEPYPNIVNPSSRSLHSQSESWSVAYDARDYAFAMLAIEKELLLSPDSVDLLFYHGQAAMATNQLSKASGQLQVVLNRDSSRYTGPAIWYLSLIEFKQGRNEATKKYLDRLISGHSDYEDKAKELYAIINK
ncbi:hypothetical protein QQ020_02170 [Fulvivirgaceae bacterium BMA12]|uniref:Tetratricopeptide repeat protein n=1 Tax=Agaribacillus aureus TaxID=3051825 RepID=A0ABT8L164_9BACT|nr:hypothetical protein [Fulvivirgaceae bacterium BMA12]